MVTITCKFTGIQFEAATKRTQVHPTIAAWKQQANKRGWYTRFFEAIEFGVQSNFTKIEQFEEVLEKAELDEPFEAPPPTHQCLRDTLDELLGVEERSSGSWLKHLRSLDTSIDSGYSLVGDFLDLDADTNLADGIYVDCATLVTSSTDIAKRRKPRSKYTLFSIKDSIPTVLLTFWGRRLNESPELKQLWELAIEHGISNVAAPIAQNCPIKFSSTEYLGGERSVVKHEDEWVTIVRIEEEYEDEDGIISSHYPRGTYVVATWYKYSVRPATKEEIAEKLASLELERQEKALKEEAARAVKRLKEIANVQPREFPETADVSEGLKISIRDKELSYDSPYLQVDKMNNRLWSIHYNGRDGDDWSYNNYQAGYVASWQPLTPDLMTEIEQLASSIHLAFPAAVSFLPN